MTSKTYREQIQELINQMNHIYEACGNLRDFATGDEKKYWNETRGTFYSDAQKHLMKLDNSLSEERAKELMPDYSTKNK